MNARSAKLFDQVRRLNLPLGQYAITSSGPLGIRGVREIGDVDIIASQSLWDQLADTYQPVEESGVRKLRVSEDIEVLDEATFGKRDLNDPSIDEQIAQADVIEGLAFVSLPHVLYWKRKMNRPKDQADIAAIQNLLRGPRGNQ